jgi:hypothetical protein
MSPGLTLQDANGHPLPFLPYDLGVLHGTADDASAQLVVASAEKGGDGDGDRARTVVVGCLRARRGDRELQLRQRAVVSTCPSTLAGSATICGQFQVTKPSGRTREAPEGEIP